MRNGSNIIINIICYALLGISINVEAGLFGFGGDSWKEEVLLHDGSKMVVTRTVKRGGRHEIGQEPPIKEQSLVFTLPSTNEKVIWEDKFAIDVGGANFLPMMLEVREGVVYLVAYPMGCLSYNKWGRPNPPYVVFKYRGKTWQRIALEELPAELTIPNLIFSSPDSEAKKAGRGIISAETIKKLYEGYKHPEYKTILRQPVKSEGQEMCPELIRTGGGWKSLDWFKDQPSLDACLKFCTKEKVSSQNCPCTPLFGTAKTPISITPSDR